MEANVIEAGEKQKRAYDSKASVRPPFKTGDHVWLAISPTHKLDRRWESDWVVKELLPNELSIMIKIGKGKTRIVHANRLRLHVLRKASRVESKSNSISEWEEPLQHEIYYEPDESTLAEETLSPGHQPSSTPPSVHEPSPTAPNREPVLRRSQRNRAPPAWYGTFVL